MPRNKLGFAVATAVALLTTYPTTAAPLFSENFEVDPTASWTVNNGPSDEAHDFFFDYSTVGIPAAPSGAGTRGMKLQANLANGIFGGMSVSPTGQTFTGNYTVSFDLWSNFNGPFPGGGSGSTNLSTYGVGTAGGTPQWPGGVQDSVWFANTGDGGSAADWRAYSPAASTSYLDGDPVYAAATRNNTDPYYVGFGGVSAPAAQLLLFPQQTGTTNVGSSGMDWHQVIIDVNSGIVTWTVDGLLLATVDASEMTLGGGNIFFGHSDTNASSSTDPNDAALLFTLIDNVVVTPEPGSLTLLTLAALTLIAPQRRPRRHL
ncbi:MAG: hypothetical protein IT442_13375 [Phycisphaeraceae bacterium]|nr:hypothetical protein [Phycisphaeraceae bacterium]